MSATEKDSLWSAASFDGARVAQAREFATRPFIERLKWNCEMSEMIRLKCLKEGKIPPALDSDRYK